MYTENREIPNRENSKRMLGSTTDKLYFHKMKKVERPLVRNQGTGMFELFSSLFSFLPQMFTERLLFFFILNTSSIELYFTYYTIYLSKVFNSVVLSIFTVLCSHHHIN